MNKRRVFREKRVQLDGDTYAVDVTGSVYRLQWRTRQKVGPMKAEMVRKTLLRQAQAEKQEEAQLRSGLRGEAEE